MKSFIIISYFFLTSLLCYSQTNLSDSALIKNFKKTSLTGCQLYHKLPNAINCKDTSWLICSYEFDDKGNIAKKIKSTMGEDTTLRIFSYDKNNKMLSEITYGARYSQPVLTEFSYNEKGKMTKRINYSFNNGVKQEDFSKVEYYYTGFDSLSKLIIYEYFPLKKGYDTVYINEYTYNANKLKESITVRDIAGYYYSPIGAGVTKYRYDNHNKLEEISHFAKRGKHNEIDNPENNYNLFYLYSCDSLISETCMQQDYYSKDIVIRNRQNKLSKKYSSTIHFSNQLYLKQETNIPDIERNVNELKIEAKVFIYDSFGRIVKIVHEWDDKDKASGWKSSGTSYSIFIYDDENSFILPEEEYEKSF